MKIYLVLAGAFALAAAKSRGRGRYRDSEYQSSDYGAQVAYSGNGIPVAPLVAHQDVVVSHGGYGGHGHGGGGHYDGGGVGHAHALIDNPYHGGGHGGSNGLIGHGPGGLGVGPVLHHHGDHGLLGPGPAPLGPGPGLGPGHLDIAPDISKSVFVFSAPPDPSDLAHPRTIISKIPITRPQKHYQVVFINAPTPPPPPQHKLELPPHPELKTLVYVLVKKPERSRPIKVIKPIPRVPSKPEVYFIRYKGKHAYGYGPNGEPFGEIPLNHGHGGIDHGHGHGGLDHGHSIHAHSPGPDYGPSHGLATAGQFAEPPVGMYDDYGHAAGSENRLETSAPSEYDTGVSGI